MTRSPVRQRKAGRSLPLLFIMARLPIAGAVKTRLARRIGAIGAVSLYRSLLASTLRQAGQDKRWRTILAVTPPTAVHNPLWRRLAPGCEVLAQSSGDLGHRMGCLLAHAGAAPAAVMGSDIVDVKAGHIAAAFSALNGADAVIAYAEDGGFWFCAVKGVAPRFPVAKAGAFAGIGWSRSDTGELTRKALQAKGFRVASGPIRRDVDD